MYLLLLNILGRILSVNTVSVSICKNEFPCDEIIDTSRCRWEDEYIYHKIYFVRVFLEEGPPQNELIGMSMSDTQHGYRLLVSISFKLVLKAPSILCSTSSLSSTAWWSIHLIFSPIWSHVNENEKPKIKKSKVSNIEKKNNGLERMLDRYQSPNFGVNALDGF